MSAIHPAKPFTPRGWSREEIALLRRLAPTAPSISAMAKQLRRRRSSIAGKVRELGLKLPVRRQNGSGLIWSPEDDERLHSGWQQGESASSIGIALGRTRDAVLCRRKRLGLPSRDDPIAHGIEPLPVPPPPPGPRRAIYSPKQAAAVTRLERIISRMRLNGTGARIDRSCQWIEGEASADDACKCGAEVITGSPYCLKHTLRAYNFEKDRSFAAVLKEMK